MSDARADTTRDLDTDVLVVGAGPIGIECAAALANAGIDFEHIDAGPIGSTMAWWAPGTQFFSSPERIGIAGIPLVTRDQHKASREEYLDYLRLVVRTRGLRVRTFERLVAVDRDRDRRFHLTTERTPGGRRSIAASRIVLATGDMHRPKALGIPGEDLPHVSHYLRELHRYFDRDVLIVGGRNSAVEAAIRLYRLGARVAISYRRATFSKKVKYWLRPELLWLIDSGRIGFYPDSCVTELRTSGQVRLARSASPQLADAHDGWSHTILADDVLLMTGYEQDPTLFNMFGLELAGPERRPVLDEQTMESTTPGVFVAGTATAGTQASGVTQFIETSHVHVERIAAALQGQRTDAADVRYQLEES